MEEHKLSRRIFLKSSGGAAAVVGTVGAALLPSEAQAAGLLTAPDAKLVPVLAISGTLVTP